MAVLLQRSDVYAHDIKLPRVLTLRAELERQVKAGI